MKTWHFLGALTLVTGYGYFAGIEAVETVFILLGLGTLLGCTVWSLRTYQDWLNPLTLLIGSAGIRIGLPALILVWSDPPLRMSWLLSFPDVYWGFGEGLALIGLVSIAVGWLVMPRWLGRIGETFAYSVSMRCRLDKPIGGIATGYMVLGLGFLAVFMGLNFANPLDAITSGILRGPDARMPETSRYSFLGNWLLGTGSVLLTARLLLQRRLKFLVGLLPVVFCTIVFTPYGGRVGAITPVVYGILIWWYQKAQRKVQLIKMIMGLATAMLATVVYAAFVYSYRGAGIERGMSAMGWDGLKEYLDFALWSELGVLPPFALATYLGPGSVEGGIWLLIGAPILDVVFGMESTHPGVFIVEQFATFQKMWRIHTGFIVDLYMTTHLAGVIVGCMLFGAIVRCAYESFYAHRDTPAVVALYSIFIWQAVWIFYESIKNIIPMMIAILFFLSSFLIASLVRPRQKGISPLVAR